MSLIPPALQWLPVTGITHAGDKPCLCLAVSSELRCYVTAPGLVTHNTDTTTVLEALPEKPLALVDAMLRGQDLTEAALTADIPVQRAPDIARNIGRVLANAWNPRGYSEEDALRTLAQRAQELTDEDGTGPVPIPARDASPRLRSLTSSEAKSQGFTRHGWHGTKNPNPLSVLAVRHGTNQGPFGEAIGVQRHAIFFSPDKEFASKFGTPRPYHLRIRNAIDLSDGISVEMEDRLVGAGVISPEEANSLQSWELLDGEMGERFLRWAKSQGYDAAKVEEPTENGAWSYAVFDPDQIALNVTQYDEAGDEQRGLRLGSARRAPSQAPGTNNQEPPGAWAYNHADRWLTGKLGDLSRAVGVPQMLSRLAGATERHVPFFREALRVLREQATPNHFIMPEAMALLREMQTKAAFGREMALDVHRSLEGKGKFTDLAIPQDLAKAPAAKKRLYLAMTGEIPLDSLPEHHRALATRLRAMLTEAGTEAVRQGRMSPDTLAMLQESYLPHYYEDDLKQDSIFRKAARLFGLHDVLAQRTTAWHIIDSEKNDPRVAGEKALVSWDDKGSRWRFKSQEHRDAFYTDFIKDQTLQELKGRGDKLRNITRDQLDRLETIDAESRGKIKEIQVRLRRRFEKRAPLSVEEQEKAGLIFDPIYSTVRYLAEMHRNNAVAGFFNAVAANKDWVSDTETIGFRKMPDTRGYGALAGKYVVDPIANQVEAIAGDESPLMELYDDLVRLWASGKTVWNPGTHVRNVLGNIPFSQLSGTNALNPTNWSYYRDGITAIREGGDTLRELYQHGVLGGDYGSQELKSALRELLPDASLMGEENPTRLIARLTKRLFDKSTSKAGRGLQHTSAFLHAAYQFSDDAFKAAAYLKARALGQTPEEAAAHVRKWYPYYDHIGSSSGIKFARRLFPFISFFRESLRIFAHAVQERPLSLAGTMVLPYVLTQVSMALLGLEDEDREEVLKDMRGKLKFQGMTGDFPAFALLLPWRMQGKLAQFDLSNVMPFAGFLGRPLETAQTDDWISYIARQLLTSGPAGNILVGLGTNADPFSGRNLVEEDMSPAEKAMQRAKYVWTTLAPPLLGTSSLMIANATERSTNKTLEKRNLGQAVLRGIMGLDVRNASPDLYRLAEDFRKEHGLPMDQAWAGGTTAQQRLRRELFSELVQDTPDLPAIARIVQSLETSGSPVRDADDLNKLLFYRNPMMIIEGKENQQRFRASLSGESRAVLEDALAEFERIKRTAPTVLAAARRQMQKT